MEKYKLFLRMNEIHKSINSACIEDNSLKCLSN